jgi:hypothetical protein
MSDTDMPSNRKAGFVATLFDARSAALDAMASHDDLVGQASDEHVEAQAVFKAADIALAMLVEGYRPDEDAINDGSILVADHIDGDGAPT